jgi:hypothetical protein
MDRPLSLSLSAIDWADRKEQSGVRSAQSSALVSALRSLSSVALSSARVPEVYHIRFLSPAKGDISTLQMWGHFYFALTEQFLLRRLLIEAG